MLGLVDINGTWVPMQAGPKLQEKKYFNPL